MMEAMARMQSGSAKPCARLIQPTEKHWRIFQRKFHEGNADGKIDAETQKTIRTAPQNTAGLSDIKRPGITAAEYALWD